MLENDLEILGVTAIEDRLQVVFLIQLFTCLLSIITQIGLLTLLSSFDQM